jgi:hypothetical protein
MGAARCAMVLLVIAMGWTNIDGAGAEWGHEFDRLTLLGYLTDHATLMGLKPPTIDGLNQRKGDFIN